MKDSPAFYISHDDHSVCFKMVIYDFQMIWKYVATVTHGKGYGQ